MKKIIFFAIVFSGLIGLAADAQTRTEETLFQEAKLLLFDEKWEEAQVKLEELLEQFPRSRLLPQALFYRAKCLSRQKGEQERAIKAYEDYLFTPGKNESLVEEAETSIIDLAYDLYAEKGNTGSLEKIMSRLYSPSLKVRYYAALKLSLIKDKKTASRAIPILKQIIEQEADQDFQDRARIALLRISPEALREVEDKGTPRRAKMLRIRVSVRGMDDPAFDLSIPWALADLALSAIPEKDKAALRQEGYDLDKIVVELTTMKGKIIKFWSKETPARLIEIWIE